MYITELSLFLTYYSGIIVTGGFNYGGPNDGVQDWVELIREDGSTCELPPLPAGRHSHTQSGLTTCGGEGGSFDNCITFSNGQWVTSPPLSHGQEGHVAWSSHPDGPLFLGPGSTAQFLYNASATFTLAYSFWYYARKQNML